MLSLARLCRTHRMRRLFCGDKIERLQQGRSLRRRSSTVVLRTTAWAVAEKHGLQGVLNTEPYTTRNVFFKKSLFFPINLTFSAAKCHRYQPLLPSKARSHAVKCRKDRVSICSRGC